MAKEKFHPTTFASIALIFITILVSSTALAGSEQNNSHVIPHAYVSDGEGGNVFVIDAAKDKGSVAKNIC